MLIKSAMHTLVHAQSGCKGTKKMLVLIQFLCKKSLVSLKNTIYFSKFAPFQREM